MVICFYFSFSSVSMILHWSQIEGYLFPIFSALTLDVFFDIISVLTPYYKEDVLYSDDELHKENEDGITILFYLKTIYRGE